MNELTAFAKARPTIPSLSEEERNRIWDQLTGGDSAVGSGQDPIEREAAAAPMHTDVLRISDDRPPVRARRNLVMTAAAAITVLGVGGGVLIATNRMAPDDPSPPSVQVDATGSPAPSPQPAILLPTNLRPPGSIIPEVEHPPTGFDPLVTAQRDSGFRTGYWTATAIARTSGTARLDPIAVTAFDGSWSALDGATEITIDGTLYLRAQWYTHTVLATTTTPTIAASGTVDPELLRDVLDSFMLDTSSRPFAATFADLPDGYEQITPFRELATDPTPRTTLANTDGTLAINEVSDWVDPVLYAASTGADMTAEGVGVGTGWSGTTTSNPYAALTFLVWAPEPGVVFEIVSTDPTRTISDLIALANATSSTTSTAGG